MELGSLYEAASWEVYIQVKSGQTFEMAVTDVVGRSQWFRECQGQHL